MGVTVGFCTCIGNLRSRDFVGNTTWMSNDDRIRDRDRERKGGRLLSLFIFFIAFFLAHFIT